MNDNEGHVGYREALALAVAVIAANVLMQHPTFLIQDGSTAGWQIALVSAAAAIAAFWPTAALMRRFPGDGLGTVAEKAAGPLGSLVALALAGAFFLLSIMALRTMTETFIISILPETPPSVLVLGLLLCAMVASYRGIEPLGRAALLFLPVGIAAAVLLLALTWNRIHWPWLHPFWGYGLDATLSDGILYAGGFSKATALLAIGYAIREGQHGGKAGRYAIIIAGLILTAMTGAFVTTFGYQDAAQEPFPAFMIARNIYQGRFFQRVESVFVLLWFFTAVLQISLLFHAVVATVTDVLHLPLHRPLVVPVGVLLFASAFLPHDFRVLMEMQRIMLTWGGWIMFALPALLLLMAIVRGKKGGRTNRA